MLEFFSKKVNENSEELALDKEKMPKHIAIIMDGNGRWAKKRGLPRTMGHRAGVQTIKTVTKECGNLGVKYLTLYAFSTENWKRPKEEVSALMNLVIEFIKNEIDELHENNVKVQTIGDLSKFPQKPRQAILWAIDKTKENTGVVLTLALNYGGRDEILRGIKSLVEDVKVGKIDIDDIKESLFNNYLYTKNMPDPDLIIRPSGEQRLSNFLLWQCAYSEFWYSQINWPDFKAEDLRKAIFDYQNRDRRFGGIK